MTLQPSGSFPPYSTVLEELLLLECTMIWSRGYKCRRASETASSEVGLLSERASIQRPANVSLLRTQKFTVYPSVESLTYESRPHAGPSHVEFPYAESTTSALPVLRDRLPVNRGPNDIYDEDTHGFLTETQLALQLYAEDLQLSTMIAELTIEDVAELQGQQMGKGRDDASPSDAALVLELYAEEAQLCIRIQNDHLFALKIHEAENGSSSPAEEITTPQTTVRSDTPRGMQNAHLQLVQIPGQCQQRTHLCC
ncbi:hypothetical protein HETIRDRAFT_431164 [Heterobasidion irregulare TC 32-1]|uniref:Uncharacterized protein n=1 Tax=Heterobasidion irregulare (strain TC 32-1) TaxID=747525 RepID=W4JPI3_HETIT|nr:uncharacterized protein HETIRDRAFT_431164 [Heterobasidion irregulare TC 32-1]ETW75000.1 hypothetical protein HETIRDRAFT_431164 [Heterobasidion irregulare TC 32-1]